MKNESSPLTDVMDFYDVEMTLDAWLESSEATDTLDFEILESLPVGFHDEYIDRVRLHSEYEAKWEAQRSATKS